MKNTFVRVVTLTINILLCIGLFVFGTITILKIAEKLDTKEAIEQGTGWGEVEDSEITLKEGMAQTFGDLCQMLEDILRNNNEIHVDTINRTPDEYSELWEYMSEVSTMDAAELNNEEWLLYQKIRWSYSLYEEGEQLPDYSNVLSDISGVLNKLPEIFYTWSFESKQDVEEYEEALKQIPEILNRLCTKLEKQYKLGMTYSDEVIQDRIAFCKEQCEQESVFLQYFENKIQNCEFLTDTEKRSFIASNQKKVQKYVSAAFEEVIQTLENLGEFEGNKGLCLYVRGKEYFEHILKERTGTEYSAQQMYDYLDEKRLELQIKMANMNNIAIDESNSDESIEEILFELYANTIIHFPKIEEISYKIMEIPEGMDQSLYLAFYLKDSEDNNFIYLREDAIEEDFLTLYQTLAHEAFPGHMYHYNYMENIAYPMLTKQLKCLGNSEGWAIYAEIAAGDWLENEALKLAYEKLVYQKLFDEVVLCQIDIGIHAFGWTLEDIEEFSKENYGYGSLEASQMVMEVLVNNPGAYEAYVMGYYELMRLKDKYCMSGEISEYEFIEAYQRCGQAPFSIVEEYLEKYFGAHTE